MSTTAATTRKLLVTGGSGGLGRLVLERLLELQKDVGKNGRFEIVTTTRDASKLASFAERGVEVRQASFDDAEDTLAAAFAGAERLLLISTDAVLSGSDARVRQHRNAIAAAIKAGVQHIVYTSALNVRPEGTGQVGLDHYWSEVALAAASPKLSAAPATAPTFTVMRHALYCETILYSLPHALKEGSGGVWASATGGRARNYVWRRDCAHADAAELVATGRQSRVLDITGPAAVTLDAVAAAVSDIRKAAGKSAVRHQAIPADVLRAAVVGAGVPAPYADILVLFDEATAAGYDDIDAGNEILKLTGRAPASVADWLNENKAALLA